MASRTCSGPEQVLLPCLQIQRSHGKHNKFGRNKIVSCLAANHQETRKLFETKHNILNGKKRKEEEEVKRDAVSRFIEQTQQKPINYWKKCVCTKFEYEPSVQATNSDQRLNEG